MIMPLIILKATTLITDLEKALGFNMSNKLRVTNNCLQG